jgi:mono/diheme cytochrome c family protein
LNWRTVKAAIAAALALIAIALIALPAAAQDLPGDARAGQKLVAAWCSECHLIGTPGPRGNAIGPGPAFADIAKLPSTTALALRVFLQSSHDHFFRRMPNVQLTRTEADDIIAYILSLKRN